MTRPWWRRLINQRMAWWTTGVAVVTLTGYATAIGLGRVLELVVDSESTPPDQVPRVAAASFAIAAELIGMLLSWAVWFRRDLSRSPAARNDR